jgi:hypothetical protein
MLHGESGNSKLWVGARGAAASWSLPGWARGARAARETHTYVKT